MMAKDNNPKRSLSENKLADDVLDEEIKTALALDFLATTPAPEMAERMKKKLTTRVKETVKQQHFIFAEQGEWRELSKGVEVKVLNQAAQQRSMLLRMEAGSVIPPHEHAQDEEVIVLQGEVWLEGIHCKTGDYHYAHAGSKHEHIHSDVGCLLFLKTL